MCNPFKVQVNFDIPIFQTQIEVHALARWLNLLEGYFLVHGFSKGKYYFFSPRGSTSFEGLVGNLM